MLAGHGGKGGRDEAAEGDDDTAILADAEDVALDSLEGTKDDLYLLAVGEDYLGIVQVEEPFIGLTGDADEVLHGLVGNGHRPGCALVDGVTESGISFMQLFPWVEDITGGVDKDEVVDEGCRVLFDLPILLGSHLMGGNIALETVVLQKLHGFHLAAVAASHDVPAEFVSVTTADSLDFFLGGVLLADRCFAHGHILGTPTCVCRCGRLWV